MDSLFNEERRDGGFLPKVPLPPEAVTHGLGWFSIARGLAELVAPRTVSRAAGTANNLGLVRLYGLRELACGIGILASRNPAPFLWARVGGDVLDLTTLAATSNVANARVGSRAMRAVVNVIGITALDVYAAQGCSHRTETRRASCASAHDYSDRTGFRRAPSEMRGAALSDFDVPRDMRAPEALQSYTRSEGASKGGSQVPMDPARFTEQGA
jgi:hypothetical protein